MATKKPLVVYSGSIEELRAGDNLGSNGDVTGPSSASDNAITRYDGTTGKLIQDSSVTLDDTGNIENVNSINFDITPTTPPTGEGAMYWNADLGGVAINMAGGDVVQEVGENQYIYCRASSAITKGQVVMFTGAVGASGIPTGAPATGITDGTYIIGIAAESIALNEFGFIQTFGVLKPVDTTGFAEGDILWYDPAVAGGFTKTKPSAPNVKVQLAAVVTGGGSSGAILIRVTAGSVLGGTDSNVEFGTLASGNIILYDADLSLWKNITINGTTNEVTVTSTKDGITISLPDTISASITGNAATVTNGLYTTDLGVTVQGYDADLAAIAGLTGTTGLLRKTAANTWSLDTTAYTTNTGTVTSVGLTLPTGLSVSGSPITTSGTLAVTFTAGYSIPTTSDQTNWNTAYGWGNHASAGYLTGADVGVSVQAYDADIPTASASQAEMETGTETALRSMSPLRVAQAINALAGGGGGFSNMEVFTSNGTFTVPAGITKVKVTVIGGGGGGTTGSSNRAGGGGAGGGSAIEIISGLTPADTVTITVGAGGAGALNASSGGTSSFGAYCSATGGAGSTGTNILVGTSGGVGSGGQLNIKGGAGNRAGAAAGTSSIYALPGSGGNSILGGGGSPTGGNGENGGNYGGGGAGGNQTGLGSTLGGNGANGVVIVEY